MPSTLRQIADHLVAQVAAIPGVGATGKKIRHWAETQSLPAAYLGVADESKDYASTRTIESETLFFFHTIVAGDVPLETFMDFYEQIEEVVADDPTLGGLVNGGSGAVVTGFNPFNTSDIISRGLYVADVFVRVVYRHERGNP